MDPTEMRLRRIELILQAAQKNADLQSHWRLAVLGAGLTLAGSTTFGAFLGQLPWAPAAAATSGAAIIVLLEIRALRRISMRLQVATVQAVRDIDTLMREGGEQDADGEVADPG
ncbi:MAG TPA: hypothetical protein VGR28_05395 [Candidatus Thermoplasmatota archaeon]|nr:hypothetical protein [Candidatus Thermoplasmatota archaeon]